MPITTITVRGDYEAPDGSPATGWVALSLLEPRQVHGTDPAFVTSKRVVAELTDGSFSAAVVASDDPAWADGPRLFKVEEHLAQHPHHEWHCYLNGPGPIDLPSVAPIDPETCGVTVPTTSHAALTDLNEGDPHGALYAKVGHEHDPGESHDHTELNDTLYAPLGHSHQPAPDSNWSWTDALSGDPGQGYIGADTALWQDVTQVRMSHIDGDGNDLPDLPEAINPGDTLTLSNLDTNEVGIYAINAVTDQGTWFLMSVTYDRGGGGNPLPDAPMKVSVTLQSAAPHDHYADHWTKSESDALYAATGHDHDADYEPAGAVATHDSGPSHVGQFEAAGAVAAHEATNGLFFHGTMWRGTQAQYDALTPEATTLYLIVG